jgi:hypothetical protein
MSIVDTIRERAQPFRKSERDLTKQAMSAMERGLELVAKVATHAEQVRRNTHLSEIGKRELLRSATAGHVREMHGVALDVNRIKISIARNKSELKIPPFPNDPASVQVRAEIRRHLLTRPDERYQLLKDTRMADPAVVQAILEAPAFLTGVAPAVVAHLRDELLDRHHGAALDDLKADGEAVLVASVAAQAAYAEIEQAAGMEQHEFCVFVSRLVTPENFKIEAGRVDPAYPVWRAAADATSLWTDAITRITDFDKQHAPAQTEAA